MRFLLLTLLLSTHLSAEVTSGLIKMSENRELLISYHVQEKADESSETRSSDYIYILAPGVNRGMLPDDKIMKYLEENKFNFVSFHNSTHPHSIINSKLEKKPFHQEKFFETQDYADEYTFIAKWAEQHFNLKAIPVSLSFSGAASSKLKGFDYIIDISPMISQKDALPELASYRELLERTNVFNPMREFVIRKAMDQSYAYVWRPQAKEFVEAYKLDNKFTNYIYEGYMASSRSLEKFNWNVEEDSQTQRIFIIGENEKESLKAGQIRTIKEYLDSGKNFTCFYMRGLGHSIPMEAPNYAMAILEFVTNKHSQLQSGCYDVSTELKAEFFAPTEIDKLFPAEKED